MGLSGAAGEQRWAKRGGQGLQNYKCIVCVFKVECLYGGDAGKWKKQKPKQWPLSSHDVCFSSLIQPPNFNRGEGAQGSDAGIWAKYSEQINSSYIGVYHLLHVKAHVHIVQLILLVQMEMISWTARQGGRPGPCPEEFADEMWRARCCRRRGNTTRAEAQLLFLAHSEASFPVCCLPLMWIISPLLKSSLPEVLRSLSCSWFSSYLSRCPCIVFFTCFSPPCYQTSLGHCLNPSPQSSLCPQDSSILPPTSVIVFVLTTHRSISSALLSPFYNSSCSTFSFMSLSLLPPRIVSFQAGPQSSPFLRVAVGMVTTLLHVPEGDWLTRMCLLCPLHPTQRHGQH